jgi:hypothetical protein
MEAADPRPSPEQIGGAPLELSFAATRENHKELFVSVD